MVNNKLYEQIILLAQEMFCKHKLNGKQRNKIELLRQRKKY